MKDRFQVLETDERVCDPLNKMWMIHLDKERCYRHKTYLLSCVKEEEIAEMKVKDEKKYIFFTGLSSVCLQFPSLSLGTI